MNTMQAKIRLAIHVSSQQICTSRLERKTVVHTIFKRSTHARNYILRSVSESSTGKLFYTTVRLFNNLKLFMQIGKDIALAFTRLLAVVLYSIKDQQLKSMRVSLNA